MPHIPTDVRRQQFIDAAIAVIARDGVDGATTRRISDEAGAPLASLHYCFQTKENLLWAVFVTLEGAVRVDLGEVVTSRSSIGAVASSLVRATVSRAIAWPDGNRAQIEIWLWAQRNDPELAGRLYDKFIGTCQEFLRHAKTPLPENHLESVTRVIVALVDGLCMQLVTHGDEKMVLREVQTAVEMLESYVRQLIRRRA